jgi:hypothetical protein
LPRSFFVFTLTRVFPAVMSFNTLLMSALARSFTLRVAIRGKMRRLIRPVSADRESGDVHDQPGHSKPDYVAALPALPGSRLFGPSLPSIEERAARRQKLQQDIEVSDVGGQHRETQFLSL